ncbi:MAG TPA: hypothetical protein VFD32_03495, partial [Dehalococcoidia bacterium]|nr:hypothetical protein [Dehalococcoidia bacterium]
MTTQAVNAAASRYGLTAGTPEIGAIGPIAFGPEGILFLADNARAAIVAVALDDDATPDAHPLEVERLDIRLAAYLGCAAEDVT